MPVSHYFTRLHRAACSVRCRLHWIRMSGWCITL